MSRNPIWLKKRANKDVLSETGQERSIQSDVEDCQLRHVTPTCSTRIKSLATVLMTFKTPWKEFRTDVRNKILCSGKTGKTIFQTEISRRKLNEHKFSHIPILRKALTKISAPWDCNLLSRCVLDYMYAPPKSHIYRTRPTSYLFRTISQLSERLSPGPESLSKTLKRFSSQHLNCTVFFPSWQDLDSHAKKHRVKSEIWTLPFEPREYILLCHFNPDVHQICTFVVKIYVCSYVYACVCVLNKILYLFLALKIKNNKE